MPWDTISEIQAIIVPLSVRRAVRIPLASVLPRVVSLHVEKANTETSPIAAARRSACRDDKTTLFRQRPQADELGSLDGRRRPARLAEGAFWNGKGGRAHVLRPAEVESMR